MRFARQGASGSGAGRECVVRLASVRALGFFTFGVQVECMLLNDEAAFSGDFFLPAFDFFVDEFFNAPAVNADQMVVVLSGFHFENCLAGFKMVPFKQAGLFELG